MSLPLRPLRALGLCVACVALPCCNDAAGRSPVPLPGAVRADSTRQRDPESPRALTGCGLQNLRAFTKLVGYVRFFHPSDAARRTDWDAFVIRGVRAVEQAPTADSLSATLRALFADVAPSVAIYASQAPAPPFDGNPPRGMPSSELSVVRWVHTGVRLPSATMDSPYRSALRPVPAALGLVPQVDYDSLPVPDPRRPLIVALDGGVTARIPLARWQVGPLPDSMRTWPPAPDAAGAKPSLDDRATRLAGVVLAWGVFQHFYPYFDVVQTDWDAALSRGLQEAASDADGTTFIATLERLLAALEDGHGNVMGPAIPGAQPPVALARVEGQLAVVAIGPTAPKADVRVGDVVIAIDGAPVAAVWARQLARAPSATPQWREAKAARVLLRGAPGSTVTLTLRDPLTPGAHPRDVRLTRALGPLPVPMVGASIRDLRPGILYVDLAGIDEGEFAAAVPRLARARGIVFDMRRYPRTFDVTHALAHLSDTAMRSAPFEVPRIALPDRVGWRYRDLGWPLAPTAPRFNARVAFLTGAAAISFGETIMGMVEAYHLGAIVGEATAGTNGNINPFAVPGGLVLNWTGMRVRKHDGTLLHGVGIVPTVPVMPTLAGIRAGRDEALERALQVVLNRDGSVTRSGPSRR